MRRMQELGAIAGAFTGRVPLHSQQRTFGSTEWGN
jgi:hypothetical protein